MDGRGALGVFACVSTARASQGTLWGARDRDTEASCCAGSFEGPSCMLCPRHGRRERGRDVENGEKSEGGGSAAEHH